MKMKTILLVLVFVAAVILGTESIFVDRKCTSTGLMCKSCNTVKLCTRNGTGFQEEEIGDCYGRQQLCYNGECLSEKHPSCNILYDHFNCQSVGYFPDPYNCQIYHHCIDQGNGVIKAKQVNCADGFVYNTRTLNCDEPLPTNKCGFTFVPLCKTIGQHGAVMYDKSIYFICKMHKSNILLPFLYKCSGNQFYDGNYGCR